MVMAVVVLMAMAIMIAVVADIGQAVNRKVALQLVADTGAFTGASKMAEGLNYLSYGNGWLQTIYAAWTWAYAASYGVGLANCGPVNAVTKPFKGAFQALNLPFSFYNITYPSFPYVEARRASRENIRELFPGEVDDGTSLDKVDTSA